MSVRPSVRNFGAEEEQNDNKIIRQSQSNFFKLYGLIELEVFRSSLDNTKVLFGPYRCNNLYKVLSYSVKH